MTQSTDEESADTKVDPSADAPTSADWEGRGKATKEVEEAVEWLGRASRFIRSDWAWPSVKILLVAAGKKTRVAPSCKIQTLVVSSEDI